MNNEDVPLWSDMVRRVARNVALEYPDSDADDLGQTVWEELLLAEAKAAFLEVDFSPTTRYVESGLYYAAKEAASLTRKHHLTISAQYAYRTKDVRKLLETFFDRESWGEAETPEDAASELNNVGLEMSSDLSRAWDRLVPSHKVLIFRYFGLHEKQDSKKLSAAISRMTDLINEYQWAKQGGPGTRKIISNATARHITDRDREGEPKFEGR